MNGNKPMDAVNVQKTEAGEVPVFKNIEKVNLSYISTETVQKMQSEKNIDKDVLMEPIRKFFNDGETSNSVGMHTTMAAEYIAEIFSQDEILRKSRLAILSTPVTKIPVMDIVAMGPEGDVAIPMDYKGNTADGENSASTGSVDLNARAILLPFSMQDHETKDNVMGSRLKEVVLGAFSRLFANQIEWDSLYARKKVINSGPTLNLNAGEVDKAFARVSDYFDGIITKIEQSGNVIDLADTTQFADRYLNPFVLSIAKKLIPASLRPMIDTCYMTQQTAEQYQLGLQGNLNTFQTNGSGTAQFAIANLLSEERPVLKTGGASTTLASTALRGATTISVTSATGISVGDNITLAFGQPKERSFNVKAVSGTTITLDRPVPYQYNSGLATENTVKEVTLDGVDILITAADNIIYGVYDQMSIEPQRFAREKKTEYNIHMRFDVTIVNPKKCVLIKNAKLKSGTV